MSTISLPNSSMEVESPCNKTCTLNAADICIGCGRSREEIKQWLQASRFQRLRIVDAAAARRQQLAASDQRPAG